MSLEFVRLSGNNNGIIPAGYDLVVVESSDVDNGTFDSAMTLNGFDEMGFFWDGYFTDPVYGFLAIAGGEGFSVVESI